jgi:hypothetical protein
MRKFALLGAIALAGCGSLNQYIGSQNQYIRADGQSISAQQLEADRAACASQSDDNYCMVGRGYFLFAADQAAAKQTQLAAIAVEHRKQAELAWQAAAEANRRAAAEAKRRAAAKRKKPQPAAQQSQGVSPGSAVRPGVGAFVR